MLHRRFHLPAGVAMTFGTVCGMDQIIVELISTATIAVALFGIAFCLMQTHYQRVNRSFAAFLFVVALNNLPSASARLLETSESGIIAPNIAAIWLFSALCLAPFLWMYVFILTSAAQRTPKHLYRHLLLPAISLLVGVGLCLTSSDITTALMSDDDQSMTGWPFVLLIGFGHLQLALHVQLAFYLFLIVRRLLQYQRRLRDVYASTEEHELRWIYVIGVLGILFWVAQVLILAISFKPEWAMIPTAFLDLFGLALFAATTLWGLRQRPPLLPDTNKQPPMAAELDAERDKTAPKYGKSALSPEASARLARKLRIAMEVDHLHRDPNLSLWALARHIGGSPNYISQTLNDVIGESFFDFVNGYRVAEAMKRLSTTDETVLAITYEVGFNARSSFYNAFKRVTGQTPTSYRKTVSPREGMDDVEPEAGQT